MRAVPEPVASALVDLLGGPPSALSIRGLAKVLGGLRFFELAAFEHLGIIASEGRDQGLEPNERVWAASASLAHAWRAAQLEALLPVSVGLPNAGECTRSRGPEIDDLVAALDYRSAAHIYGVLASSYERRIEFPHAAGEPFVLRTLSRLLDDLPRCVPSDAANVKSQVGEA